MTTPMNDSNHVSGCGDVGSTGLGRQLRQAREAAGLSVAELAARMHVLARIVEDIENDCFQCLGADIYIRGHLRSYAREVGLPWSEIETRCPSAPRVAGSELTCLAPRPRWQARLEALAHRSVYLVLTAAIVVPIVWLAGSRQLPVAGEPLALIESQARPGSVPVSAVVQPPETERAPQLAPASLAPRLPVAATEGAQEPAGAPASAGSQENPAWHFLFDDESWFELYDPAGRRVVHELVQAGSELEFPAERVGRVALGNASGVRVLRNGERLDLVPFQQGNVARFAVSSQGDPVPRSGDG